MWHRLREKLRKKVAYWAYMLWRHLSDPTGTDMLEHTPLYVVDLSEAKIQVRSQPLTESESKTYIPSRSNRAPALVTFDARGGMVSMFIWSPQYRTWMRDSIKGGVS